MCNFLVSESYLGLCNRDNDVWLLVVTGCVYGDIVRVQ